MKGYAKVTITNEEKEMMRHAVDKAKSFMKKYHAGEYRKLKTVRRFFFFKDEEFVEDTIKLYEDAYKEGCEVECLYGSHWVSFPQKTEAYIAILSMCEHDEIYLDSELCLYFNQLTKEQK